MIISISNITGVAIAEYSTYDKRKVFDIFQGQRTLTCAKIKFDTKPYERTLNTAASGVAGSESRIYIEKQKQSSKATLFLFLVHLQGLEPGTH